MLSDPLASIDDVIRPGTRRQKLPLRRRPRQRRARLTLSAIQQACLQILESEGETALNTNRIAEVAGISVGTLYKYFPNKETIVESLCNHLLISSLEHMEAVSETSIALARRSLDAAIGHIISAEIDRHRNILKHLKGYYRDIHWNFDYEQYVTSNLPGRIDTAQWLEKVLYKYRDQLQVEDLAIASRLVVHMIGGTIHSALSRDPEMILNDKLSGELKSAVLGYLKINPQNEC